ncbi:MAG TPA: ATP-binding protein [Myxococcales bacterium]
MRLRYQLVLLALVSAIPFVVALPRVVFEIRGKLDEELDKRLTGAQLAAHAELVRLGIEAERAVKDLAVHPDVEDIAHSLDKEGYERASLVPLGQQLMKVSGLDVLELLDAQGRILTSGHLPARAGDEDAASLKLGGAAPGKATPRRIEVKRADDAIGPALCVLVARPVDYGTTRIWVVGGKLVGEEFAGQLARLTGAAVSVRDGARELVRTGTLVAPRARTVSIDDPPTKLGEVQVELSDAPLREEQDRILRDALLLWLVLLGAAVALGILVARRMTRPVDALAQGARELAQGGFGKQIDVKATGEIKDLVDAFNAMSRDIKETSERAAVAERVAAWQGIARRLAHEIKNPLTPIRMSVETLLAAHKSRRADFDEIFKESAGAVLEEVERLRRIVDEFSKFARLPKPQLTQIDVSELAGQILQLYGTSPEGMQVERQLTAGLVVSADRDQLTQVLINLVTNAEQAMSGGGKVTVRVQAVGAGEVALEVEDEGPGIRPEDRARIFEPYFTTKTGGTGLGLAIALRIAQEHGGRLEELGGAKGARFRLTLPKAKGGGALAGKQAAN